MKNKSVFKFILSFITILLVSPAFALDWGAFRNYEDNYSDYAVHKILHNIPIKYYISDITEQKQNVPENSNNSSLEEIQNQLKSSLTKEQKQAELQTLIERAFDFWRTQTKGMIQNSGRSQEFSDISAYLSRRILTQKTSNINNSDIAFHFTTRDVIKETCSKEASACITIEQEKADVYLPNLYIKGEQSYDTRKENLFIIIVHELGHYFGLTDQYEESFQSSLIYNVSDRMFNCDSIMAASYDKTLGCDDIDGFINLIDLTLALQNGGKFSARAQKGWASFCNGKKNGEGKLFKETYYKEAKPVNRSDYQRGPTVYKYDQAGNLRDWNIIHLFDLYKSKINYDFEGLVFQVNNNKGMQYTYYNYIEKGEIDIFIDTNDDLSQFNLKKYGRTWEFLGKQQRFNINIDKLCRLRENFYTTAEKFIAVFDGDNLNSYTYELTYGMREVKGLRKTDALKFTITQDYKCILESDSVQVLTLDIQNNEMLESNQQKINELARNLKLSSAEIIKEASGICKKLLNEDVNRDRETCKYFTEIENKL